MSDATAPLPLGPRPAGAGALVFATLVLCSAFGEVSTGLLVPALPTLGELFGATPARVQLTLVAFAVATALETDSHGRPMPDWQGCAVLDEHQLFLLLAETPDSLDGRYFGPTDAASIVARARPILTRGG